MGRAQVSKARGPGFKSHRRRFESCASSFTPRCLSLNECVCMRTSVERSVVHLWSYPKNIEKK